MESLLPINPDAFCSTCMTSFLFDLTLTAWILPVDLTLTAWILPVYLTLTAC